MAANLLSTYNLRQTEFILGVVHPFSRDLRLQTTAYANLTKGWDRLENILGGQKNYVYVHRDIGLNALLYHYFSTKRIDLYGINGSFEHEKRQDGATQHVFLRDAFRMGAAYRSQQPLARNYALFYGVSQSFSFPSASLKYPSTQESVFSTQLALPLQRYDATSIACSRIDIGAIRNFSAYQLSLSLAYQLGYALSSQPSIHGTRQYVEASLGLTF